MAESGSLAKRLSPYNRREHCWLDLQNFRYHSDDVYINIARGPEDSHLVNLMQIQEGAYNGPTKSDCWMRSYCIEPIHHTDTLNPLIPLYCTRNIDENSLLWNRYIHIRGKITFLTVITAHPCASHSLRSVMDKRALFTQIFVLNTLLCELRSTGICLIVFRKFTYQVKVRIDFNCSNFYMICFSETLLIPSAHRLRSPQQQYHASSSSVPRRVLFKISNLSKIQISSH